MIARSVSYIRENATITTIYDVPIPWERTVVIPRSVYYLSEVQCILINMGSGTYTVKIFINGREATSASGSGSSVSATAPL